MGMAHQIDEVSPSDPVSYYRARYYDTVTGRFLSEDPIGFEGGFNLYRYVKNQPTRYVDPTGKAISSVAGSTSIK